ncbi:MAG: hypothetical protein NXY57DRAFT_535834 [Lentinula lateritia]|nr:MAG: hypothetical protein NXY57DRAFT_535834 [Lentinula lateritia]
MSAWLIIRVYNSCFSFPILFYLLSTLPASVRLILRRLLSCIIVLWIELVYYIFRRVSRN